MFSRNQTNKSFRWKTDSGAQFAKNHIQFIAKLWKSCLTRRFSSAWCVITFPKCYNYTLLLPPRTLIDRDLLNLMRIKYNFSQKHTDTKRSTQECICRRNLGFMQTREVCGGWLNQTHRSCLDQLLRGYAYSTRPAMLPLLCRELTNNGETQEENSFCFNKYYSPPLYAVYCELL